MPPRRSIARLSYDPSKEVQRRQIEVDVPVHASGSGVPCPVVAQCQGVWPYPAETPYRRRLGRGRRARSYGMLHQHKKCSQAPTDASGPARCWAEKVDSGHSKARLEMGIARSRSISTYERIVFVPGHLLQNDILAIDSQRGEMILQQLDGLAARNDAIAIGAECDPRSSNFTRSAVGKRAR